MNTFTALAGAGLLLAGSAAFAQDVPGTAHTHSAPDPAAPTETATDTGASADTMASDPAVPGDTIAAEADPMADAELPTASQTADPTTSAPTNSTPATTAQAGVTAPEVAFTDAEIESFAAAALEIQNLQGDEATKQEQAATIVANAGIAPETFNAIGQAMQSDPAIAERVQLAAGGMQSAAQPES